MPAQGTHPNLLAAFTVAFRFDGVFADAFGVTSSAMWSAATWRGWRWPRVAWFAQA